MPRLQYVLRAVAEAGIGMEPANNGLLRSVGKSNLPWNLVALVKAHRHDLLNALSEDVLRSQWPTLPTGSLPIMWRPLLGWYGLERTSFSPEEGEFYEERAAVREYDGSTSRWLAEISAVEDILNLRFPMCSSSTLTRAA